VNQNGPAGRPAGPSGPRGRRSVGQRGRQLGQVDAAQAGAQLGESSVPLPTARRAAVRLVLRRQPRDLVGVQVKRRRFSIDWQAILPVRDYTTRFSILPGTKITRRTVLPSTSGATRGSASANSLIRSSFAC